MISCSNRYSEYKLAMSAIVLFFAALILSLDFCMGCPDCEPMEASDKDLLQFALNIEYTEAEYFFHGTMNKSLDDLYPDLADGGPPSVGARQAKLDCLTYRIFEEFAYQEAAHVRVISKTVGPIPRPLINLSPALFSEFVDRAVGYKLTPPFDPYVSPLNYVLGAYFLPYIGLVGYVGTIPQLRYYNTKRVTAGLLGVEAQQDEMIRAYLYERAEEKVEPYDFTVANFTNYVSILNNKLAMCGIRDEGIIVPQELGAENRTESNIIAADYNSLTYSRTPQQILRIMYGTGKESQPGGFFPRGANGYIARSSLERDY